MRNSIIVKIVSILHISRPFYSRVARIGLSLKDINYAMANEVIRYDKSIKSWGNEETSALGIPLTGDYYYKFLNSKVKLTELGYTCWIFIRGIIRREIKHNT